MNLIGQAAQEGNGYTTLEVFTFQNPVLPLCLIFLIQGLLFGYIVQLLFRARWSGTSILTGLSRNRTRKTSNSDESLVIPIDPIDTEVEGEIKKLKEDSSDYILACKGLFKGFKLPGKGGHLSVLHDLWLGVKKRECLGFLGPNGAGKTTAIKIWTGLERFDVKTT